MQTGLVSFAQVLPAVARETDLPACSTRNYVRSTENLRTLNPSLRCTVESESVSIARVLSTRPDCGSCSPRLLARNVTRYWSAIEMSPIFGVVTVILVLVGSSIAEFGKIVRAPHMVHCAFGWNEGIMWTIIIITIVFIIIIMWLGSYEVTLLQKLLGCIVYVGPLWGGSQG